MTRPHVIMEMEYFEPENGGHTVEQVLDKLDGLENPVLCFIKAGESSFARDWVGQFEEFVQQLRLVRSDLTIHLTANFYHRDQERRLRNTFDSVLLALDGIARTYYNLIDQPVCEMSQQWNNESRHFLCLMGKPDRHHRIGLLYQLDRAGLLDQGVWSLHMTDSLIKKSSDILSEFGCQNPVEWIQQHTRSPDQADIVIVKDLGLHYSGVPFDKKLYDSPLFQIVSETDHKNDRPPWITEKIALAIANKNPFLLAGVPGTLQQIKNIGFRTFEDYCLHQDYDSDYDDSSRLRKVVENADFWLKNIRKFTTEIQKDLEHNFSRFLELGKQYIRDADLTVQRLQINCKGADILPIFDPIAHASWKKWYDRIRDPQWPDCDREEDFTKLPEWIQKECIEVFGYQPKEKA